MNIKQALDKLNSTSEGWTNCGNLFVNTNDDGGIIDTAIASDLWFVVGEEVVEGIITLEEAVDIFISM